MNLLILSLVAWLAEDWFSLPVSLLAVGLIITAGAIALIFLIKRHSGNLDFKATRRHLGSGSCNEHPSASTIRLILSRDAFGLKNCN